MRSEFSEWYLASCLVTVSIKVGRTVRAAKESDLCESEHLSKSVEEEDVEVGLRNQGSPSLSKFRESLVVLLAGCL